MLVGRPLVRRVRLIDCTHGREVRVLVALRLLVRGHGHLVRTHWAVLVGCAWVPEWRIVLISVGARRHHIVALLMTEAVRSTLTVRVQLLVLIVKFAEASFRDRGDFLRCWSGYRGRLRSHRQLIAVLDGLTFPCFARPPAEGDSGQILLRALRVHRFA